MTIKDIIANKEGKNKEDAHKKKSSEMELRKGRREIYSKWQKQIMTSAERLLLQVSSDAFLF